jgi:glycosidase
MTAARTGLILAAFTMLGTSAGAEEPLTVKNRHFALGFDRQTGAWTSFVDAATQTELIAGPVPRVLVPPGPAPTLDRARVARAIAAGQAVDLSEGWVYTPTPPTDDQAAAVRSGRFDVVRWVATRVPSRRGTGDDRLHDRNGIFYYRRTFTTPPGAGDRMLVLGAVDDFDTTYLNGTHIGATGVEMPHHWESPRFYRVPAKLLREDGPNVLLIKATNGGFDGGLDGPIVLGAPDALMSPAAAGPGLTRHKLGRRERSTVLTLVAGAPLEYRVEVVVPDDEPWLSRQITVTNRGDKETLLQGQPILSTPPLSVGPHQAVSFPGSLPVGDRPLTELSEGEVQGPRSQDPLVVLRDESTRLGLGSWYHSEDEYAPVSVVRRGAAAEIRHTQQVIVRLGPGRSVTLGRQFVWLTHGTRDDTLRGVQAIYREVGLHAPEGGLPGLRGSVLYCGHPGGTPEQQFRTYGGFSALERYLPTLEKLNVDLLWLLPIWEHGDGRRWNLYSPFDHFRVSPIYGTADDLKRLSAAAAKGNIQLMFDLVPHGPPDFTPLAKEHPEWITREASGKLHYEWGQYAFDNAHPGWQDYMRRAAVWDAREFGAVGARVDCAAGGAPNWDPAQGDRPSRSTLAAGLGMNRAIRDGFRTGGRPVVLLPEEYTGATIFNSVADLTYDAQLYFLMVDLHARQAPPGEWAGQIGQFLHDQQQALPPGALKMRWISNHDTVSWTFQKKRPLALYGVDRMRALLALCALVDGVPMLYQGDEDPAVYGAKGPSSVEWLARVYALRKRLPALREGTADYRAVHASEGVFACVRQNDTQRVLVLISFSPAPVTTHVSGLARLDGGWHDELAGEDVTAGASGQIAMAPHQVRILVSKSP